MPKGVHSNHLRGPSHPNWKGGVSTYRNYIQVYDRLTNQTMEGHRKVMKDLAAVGSYYPLGENGIPMVHYGGDLNSPRQVMDVHHFDGDSTHNCWCNIMYLQRCIHARVGKYKGVRDPETGRWMSWEGWGEKYGEEV